MNILLFGVLAEAIGKSEIKLSANDSDTLKKDLLNRYPVLKQYRFQFAINKEILNNNVVLSDSDEIALLPPFAGG